MKRSGSVLNTPEHGTQIGGWMHRNHIASPAKSPTHERDTGRKRVIHYVCASTDEQINSVPGHLRELRKYSERHDHEVIAVIHDEGEI